MCHSVGRSHERDILLSLHRNLTETSRSLLKILEAELLRAAQHQNTFDKATHQASDFESQMVRAFNHLHSEFDVLLHDLYTSQRAQMSDTRTTAESFQRSLQSSLNVHLSQIEDLFEVALTVRQ